LPRDASHPGVAYPQASSVATLRVAAGGAVSAQLYLADGARTAAGGFLTESAAAGIPDCPLFAELYDHKGAILGDVAFAQASPPQLSGATRWFRKAGAASGPFVAGWPAGGLISNAQGYTWVKPHAATHTAAAVTPLNGLSPTGGNVHLDLGSTGFDLQLSGLGRFTVSPSDASKLSLTLNPATGLLTGTYHAPAGPQSFTGILAQPRTPAGTATGFLLTPTSTSTLSLSLSP
jgi:hypothetical protein